MDRSRSDDRPPRRRPTARPLYDAALRARCLRRRVRGRRRRPVPRPGPAARPGRARRRSPIAARSPPTASRATAPASALPLDRPSWRLLTGSADAAADAARRRHGVPAARPHRGARRAGRSIEQVFAERRAAGPSAGGPCRSSPPRSAPRPPPRARPSPRPSSPGPRAPTTTRGRRRRRSSGGSIVARRRLETAARDAGGRPWPSCRSRPPRAATIVYKGLVAGGRLAELYPDLRQPRRGRLRGLPPALRDEHARRSGGWPSRSARSPTTARSTRSAAIASRSAAAPATWARARSPRSSAPPARSSRRTAPTRSRSTRASSC